MYSRLLLAIQETIYYGLFNPLDTKNYALPPYIKRIFISIVDLNIYLNCGFSVHKIDWHLNGCIQLYFLFITLIHDTP